MIEVRIHGRGGEGLLATAGMLARALAREGKFVQAFPSFDIERPSAPFQAYLRFDDERIDLRCGVRSPDHLIVFDTGLLKLPETLEGFAGKGWLITNHPKRPHEMKLAEPLARFRLASVDADRIANQCGAGPGRAAAVASAMAGAFARATGIISIESLAVSMKESDDHRLAGCVDCARTAHEEVCFGR